MWRFGIFKVTIIHKVSFPIKAIWLAIYKNPNISEYNCFDPLFKKGLFVGHCSLNNSHTHYKNIVQCRHIFSLFVWSLEF